MRKSITLAQILPLFLVIVIDSMGLGILFPILSSMIIDPHSTFLAASTSNLKREFLYGMIIGVYMIAWFFGSAILSDLSDGIGRRKSLLICLLGACFGYVLAGVAFYAQSITLLMVGRIIAGFTAGSQPIAQAAIVDISSPENKARNIAYILLAASLGFVFGPLAGGLLSDNQLVPWFSYALPMFFAGAISLLNAILLWCFFKETFVAKRKIKIQPSLAIQIFVAAFRHPAIRWLSLVLLVFISGWGEYFGFMSQFLLRRYHYAAFETSMFMMVMAIGFSIGFGVLVNFCANRFNLKNCIVLNLIIASLICLVTALTYTPWFAWVGSIFVGMAVAIAYSLIITLFSNQVSDAEQGWVMGVTNSVMALSFGVTTFFSGFAAHLGEGLPILWAFLGMLLSALLLSHYRQPT